MFDKLTSDDVYHIINQTVQENRLAAHSLDSMNDFYNVGIAQIMTKVFTIDTTIDNTRDKTPEDREINKIRFLIEFSNITLKSPTSAGYWSGKEKILTPSMACVEDRTYSSNLFVDATITAWAYKHDGTVVERNATVKNFRLTNIPTMVGSQICNTYGKSPDALVKMNEDPQDPQAYFIKSGKEWSIDNIESTAFNQPRVFNNYWNREVQRVEFISKPGDTYQNSKQIIIRLMNNGALTVEIVTPNLRGILFPFFMLFRALGWATDREMFDNIMYCDVNNPPNDPLVHRIYNILAEAMNSNYDNKNYKLGAAMEHHAQPDVLRWVISNMARENFKDLDLDGKPEHMQQAVNKVLKHFDEDLFPHIGLEEVHRHTKLRFLGHLINRMFYVYLGLLAPTDRDSYTTKRVHTVGISIGKAFKTHFNASIVNQLRKQFIKDFKAIGFNQVNLPQSFQISVNGADFERLLMQSITSATQTHLRVNRNRTIVNRLSSQLLDRKNYTKIYSTLRMIITPNPDSSKGSERAKEMRMPHPSAQGFVCYVQSADHGEKVGLHKQLCISSSICSYDSSDLLKDTLLEDSRLHKLAELGPYDIRGMCKVFVNGEWLGCVPDPTEYVRAYTNRRRAGEISRKTTIEWDNNMNEVYFWVDYGRPVRPLLIVYNNVRDWKELGLKAPAPLKDFKQGTLLSQRVLRDLKSGKIGLDDLLNMRVIEWMTPQEQIRMYVAADIGHLQNHTEDPLHQFTHCDVPQAIFGIPGLTGPMANYNQTPRNTFQTSQTRQTGGVYAYNWQHRIDKDTFLQYQVEYPLVPTVVNRYIPPNGSNIIVAVACYTGYNEEDSTVWNKITSEHGKFNGSWFSYDKVELEKNEQFANPDVTQTSGIKSYANYKKLGKNGIVQVGTVVRKGDVIVGKIKRLPKNVAEEKKVNYIDVSSVYKLEFPSIVHDVVISKDDEATTFCKIAYRSIKNSSVGDKFCKFSSAEVLTRVEGWKRLDQLSLGEEIATLNPETHQLEYQKPTAIHSFDCVDEDMYEIHSQQIHEVVTMNHKMYIKKRYRNHFELVPAVDMMGKRVSFKKNCNGLDIPEKPFYYADDGHGNIKSFPMDAWLDLLGVFIGDGWYNKDHGICISAIKERKIQHIEEIAKLLGVKLQSNYSSHPAGVNTNYGYNGKHYIRDPHVVHNLKKLSLGALNKQLPLYALELNQRQSRILLSGLLSSDGSKTNTGTLLYYTSSQDLADDIVQLALHCGYSGNIKKLSEAGTTSKFGDRDITLNADRLCVHIVRSKNEPTINHGHIKQQNGQIERVIKYTGKVMCPEVPNHIFYCRESYLDPPSWTGNSSRSG